MVIHFIPVVEGPPSIAMLQKKPMIKVTDIKDFYKVYQTLLIYDESPQLMHDALNEPAEGDEVGWVFVACSLAIYTI